MTESSLELTLKDGSKTGITLNQVTSNIPGVTVDCLFSGKLSRDKASLVTVSGCKDDEYTTISIASVLVPNGLVDLTLNQGETSLIEVRF